MTDGTSKKAILAVSFGTSVNETREKTIDVIEDSIRRAYPDYKLYRAWTSKMIIRKILKRDGIKIPTVTEAMAQMVIDGIKEVVVQPTHIINGIENDLMKEDALAYQSQMDSIRFGDPLLTTTQDNVDSIHALLTDFHDLPDDEVLVFMGHGTTHYANSVYAALDYTFKDMGHKNIFLGTVEAYPSMESLMKQVKAYQPRKVHLAPFMVVAGDHAMNDMAGDDPDSWRYQFEQAGFSVECHLKGLGEYEGIRQLYLKHVQAAMKN